MEYEILMFLHDYPEYDTATDIVGVRKLTKSHVSSALKSLKEKGLLEKFYSKSNKKTVYLRVTSRAEEILSAGEKAEHTFRQRIFFGFCDEEIEQCKDFFARLCANADNGLKR